MKPLRQPTIRKAFVAGQFYEAEPLSLQRHIERYVLNTPKQEVIGLMAPHAGYIYSGSVAGAVYSSVVIPESLIILGPNHTGIGSAVSVYPEGVWETPLHNFEIDSELADKIMQNCEHCSYDATAHYYEHSIEVHLPFIAYFRKDTKIVPIAIMKASLQDCAEIGNSLAKVLKDYDKKTLIISSSDMSHYVTDEQARKLDAMAIAKILELDPVGLYTVVAQQRITMCGVFPTVTMLFASKALGATKSSLIKYATSAETSGDYRHVVGYAGVIVQ